MPNLVKWIGGKTLELRSEEITINDKAEVVQVWVGPYDDLITGRPAIGARLVRFPGLTVTEIGIKQGDGNSGEMTVTFESSAAGDYGTGAAPTPDDPEDDYPTLGEPTFGLSFDEVILPLEAHPLCPFLNDEATAAGINFENWQKLAEAGTGNDDIIGLSLKEDPAAWSRADYIAKKTQGKDAFWKPAPVIRRTVQYFFLPATFGVGCFERETPPVIQFSGVIALYDWLKGPESVEQVGHIYTVTTEWRGSDAWDDQIYTAGA